MLSLVATVGSTVLAPFADALLRDRPRGEAFADGLLQVVVGGILLLDVVPAGLEAAGWPALVALGLGALAGVAYHDGERALAGVALAGLALHGLTDGAALATPSDGVGGSLAAAVVLHTLPVALAVWRVAVGRGGPRLGWALLALTVGCTLTGYVATGRLLAGSTPAVLGIAQCALAGALLHVLGHLGGVDGRTGRASGWGAVVGAGLVALAQEHGGSGLALAGAIAPGLVCGYAAAGLAHASLPRWFDAPGIAGRRIATVCVGLPVLGWAVTAILVAAEACASWASGRGGGPGVHLHPPAPHGGLPDRARRGAVFALAVVDRTAVWVVAGVVASAWVGPAVGPGGLAGVPSAVQIVVGAAVGLALDVSAVGAAPLAATLVAFGATHGAIVAWLVLAPLGEPRFARVGASGWAAAGYGAAAAAVAILVGLGVDGGWSAFGRVRIPDVAGSGAVSLAALVVLAGLYASTLVRHGPAGFVAPLAPARGPAADVPRRPHAHRPDAAQ